jgi:hypothetical protein
MEEVKRGGTAKPGTALAGPHPGISNPNESPPIHIINDPLSGKRKRAFTEKISEGPSWISEVAKWSYFLAFLPFLPFLAAAIGCPQADINRRLFYFFGRRNSHFIVPS